MPLYTIFSNTDWGTLDAVNCPVRQTHRCSHQHDLSQSANSFIRLFYHWSLFTIYKVLEGSLAYIELFQMHTCIHLETFFFLTKCAIILSGPDSKGSAECILWHNNVRYNQHFKTTSMHCVVFCYLIFYNIYFLCRAYFIFLERYHQVKPVSDSFCGQTYNISRDIVSITRFIPG